MANALTNTEFNFDGQKSVYHGKVRDVYNVNDDLLVMIATDRISAFDVILPKATATTSLFFTSDPYDNGDEYEVLGWIEEGDEDQEDDFDEDFDEDFDLF